MGDHDARDELTYDERVELAEAEVDELNQRVERLEGIIRAMSTAARSGLAA